MSRDELLRQARRNVAHSRQRTVPLVDGVVRVPSRNYVDYDRWRLEMDRIFRRVPLLLGFSCELAAPHSYKAFDALGVPLVLIRSDDGVIRGFVNMCSHRGAIIMEDGCGVARRMTCPYHAWTYDTQGSLVGVLDRANFGEFDMASAGLTAIPVTERAGIIFGGVVPGALGDTTFDVDPYLCGFGDMLEHLDLADCTFVGSQKVEGPNWKLAYDGYLDFYHLPILHKNTFGPTYNNRTISDAWGPHQRNVQPDDRWLALEEVPEQEWTDRRITTGVWTIFPHVSIAGFDAGGKLYMVSQLFPGDQPGTSVTVQNFLTTFEPDDEQRSLIDKQMAFLMHVVRDEDYDTGLRIQRAVATGAKQEFVFGRNEGPCQRFHGWVDRLIAAETAEDTAALYSGATEYHDP